MTKKKRCYVKIKEYHVMLGIIIMIFYQVIMCIPILNIFILNDVMMSKKVDDWKEGIFYNWKEIEVKQR